MDMTPNDLFKHLPEKLPRLRSVKGCTADRQTEDERSRFMISITLNSKIEQIRQPIMAARQHCRQIQDAINKLRGEMASHKGRSKGAKEARLAFLPKIEALRKKLAKTKIIALLK